LQGVSDYVKIVILQFEETYQDVEPEELEVQAKNLKHRLVDRYVKIQKRQLAKSMQSAQNEEQLKKLMKQADKLNELIKY
jgi:hypothetical protein